jgi:hypothetical protein
MMYELQIPALTTLQSADARAIRTIVNSLVQELGRMQKEIDELKSRPQQTNYVQTMKRQ